MRHASRIAFVRKMTQQARSKFNWNLIVDEKCCDVFNTLSVATSLDISGEMGAFAWLSWVSWFTMFTSGLDSLSYHEQKSYDKW